MLSHHLVKIGAASEQLSDGLCALFTALAHEHLAQFDGASIALLRAQPSASR